MILKKPELLAPAGNMEKMKMALLYGADAVYLGGKSYGLRALGGNFTKEELREAMDFAHRLGKKVYVTVNIFPHNDEHVISVSCSGDTFRRKIHGGGTG